MKDLINFIKYNNLVPITFGVVFLGASGAYAAQNPEALYSQSQEVVSIDNTYIVGKDLAAYTPRAQIVDVLEDEQYYYVSYTLSTIDLADYVWKDVAKPELMKVSKADLGQYRDLGVYVTAQLKQIVGRELAYLGQVQEKERRQVSVTRVATTYGGLIGRFLDVTTEELPGYVPVVATPAEEEYGNSNTTVGAEGRPSGPTGAPQIGLQVLGNNPARVPLRASYADLGAVLIDPYNINVGIYIYMNGVRVDSPTIDTSTSTSYAIEYRATDRNGVEVMTRRIVLVGDVPDPGGEISLAGNTNPALPQATQGTPEPTPTPEATPELAATSTPVEPTPKPIPTPTREPAPSAPPEAMQDTASTTPE